MEQLELFGPPVHADGHKVRCLRRTVPRAWTHVNQRMHNRTLAVHCACQECVCYLETSTHRKAPNVKT